MKGTWLMIKTGDDYSGPEFIEFDGDKIIYFDVLSASHNGTLIKEQTRTEHRSETKMEFVNANRIRFFRKGISYTVLSETKSITEDESFEVDYERIAPTKTDLTEKEIEHLVFYPRWNNETLPFNFNQNLDRPELLEAMKRLNRTGRKLLLEKLDKTYFAALYDNGERQTLIPIREIDHTKVILYGFPEKPYSIMATRE